MFSRDGYQVILFDMDGTLRHSRPSYVDGFYAIAARLGLSDTPERRVNFHRWLHYYWAQSPELIEDARAFSDDAEQFWLNHSRRQLVAFGCPPELAQNYAPQVYQFLSNEFQTQEWVPEDVPATLQALRQSGYRLAVLSNRSQPCQEDLLKLGLLEYFDFALVAGELNAWKPDPEIFRHAVERAGAEAEKTLYIGDNYYADILGAKGAGLEPVLLDPERLFPEAQCLVIESIGDLQAHLL